MPAPPSQYHPRAWVSGSVKRPSLDMTRFDFGLDFERVGNDLIVTQAGGLTGKFTEARVGDRLLKFQHQDAHNFTLSEIRQILQTELRVSFETLHPEGTYNLNSPSSPRRMSPTMSKMEESRFPRRQATPSPTRRGKKPASFRGGARPDPPTLDDDEDTGIDLTIVADEVDSLMTEDTNVRHVHSSPRRSSPNRDKPNKKSTATNTSPQWKTNKQINPSNHVSTSKRVGSDNLKNWVSGSMKRPSLKPKWDFGLDFAQRKSGKFVVTRADGLAQRFTEVRVGDVLIKFQNTPANQWTLKELQNVLQTQLYVSLETLHQESSVMQESMTEIDMEDIQVGDVFYLTQMPEKQYNGQDVQVMKEGKKGTWWVQTLGGGARTDLIVRAENLH